MTSRIYLIAFILLIISGIGTILIEDDKIVRHNSGEIKLTHEVDDISGGAEYSILMNKAIKSENFAKYRYNGFIEKNFAEGPPVVTAVTPLLWVDFDTEASTAGYYSIPPDPIGAAGPSHVVGVNNTSVKWALKDGSSATIKRLGKNVTTATGSFFESLSPVNPTFDPKVIYDQYNSRFVVVTLEQVTDGDDAADPNNTSRILVAVSATSDPTGTWYYHAINSKTTISSFETWADYPGLSVNTDAIFITNNMFTFGTNMSKGERMWIITKGAGSGGFYDSGGTAVVNVYDPATLAGTSYTTFQPAHMFGTAPSTVLTYLVGYSGLSGEGTEALRVITVTGTHASPTFTKVDVSLGDIENTVTTMPDADQNGTSTEIETNDRRALHAVWRSNFLCAVTTIVNSSTQATAHWFKVTASSSTISTSGLSDQGSIDGEDIAAGTHTFMPSIAVNSSGDMVVGFAASAPTIYPGAYYAGRLSGDGAGTTRTPVVVKAGTDYYIRKFSGSTNRWGDYSGMSIDPSDDATFWVFNQYAKTRGTDLGVGSEGLGRWETVFGLVVDAPLPVELISFSGYYKSSQGGIVNLLWETSSEINNYGFEVERSLNLGKNNNWKNIGFVQGSGNSYSNKRYSFSDRNLPNNKSLYYRLKQIDIDGAFEYSNIVEIRKTGLVEFVVNQNYPNPFNPSTQIKYQIQDASGVKVEIYSLTGELISTLVNEEHDPGQYSVLFDTSTFAGGLASGIYVYRISVNNLDTGSAHVQSKKMIFMK